MTPRQECGAAVVEIEGITPPTRFTRLSDALAALWGSVKVLPLDRDQLRFVGFCLTNPNAVEAATEKLARDGAMVLTIYLSDGLHRLTIRPATPEATAQGHTAGNPGSST
ncbi:hypothetical protein [Kitasatospora kifunensis]|uniref:Uncharacterized protein n=1 Tax=Kitasatospora kifunensis TaxID=58351 RepID=A0A7W7R6F3_KITKI|nr:hypothetical protein [Kitasatospora kifunensis]MBB4926226.1 hypothetical protein [Kitasatospora kifunensis]